MQTEQLGRRIGCSGVEAVGVVRGRRHDCLDTRVSEERVRVVGVLCGKPESGARARDDVGHGNACLATCHQSEFLGLVDDLLEGDEQQGRNLVLNDWSATRQGSTGCESREGLFGDRRVEDSVGPQFLGEPLGDAAERLTDILADKNVDGSRSISSRKGFDQRLLISELGHSATPLRGRGPSAYMQSSAAITSGRPLALANSIASSSDCSTSASIRATVSWPSLPPRRVRGSRNRQRSISSSVR